MDEQQKQSLNVKIDLRIVCAVLLLAIVALFALWQPWKSTNADGRTIQVTGESVVKAEPDEYVFRPSYSFNASKKDKAISDMTDKSNRIVEKLKSLGVTENQIKTNANNYDTLTYAYYPEKTDAGQTYTLQLTVTVKAKDIAQKVQDYLLTTSPSQQISAVPGFSNEKQKSLESQARDEATKDARQKADQSAKNLGFKIGNVKSVTDGNGFGVYPIGAEATAGTMGGVDAKSSDSMKIQPGENELSYSVTVVYYVR
jgi:uncharacterized protein